MCQNITYYGPSCVLNDIMFVKGNRHDSYLLIVHLNNMQKKIKKNNAKKYIINVLNNILW